MNIRTFLAGVMAAAIAGPALAQKAPDVAVSWDANLPADAPPADAKRAKNLTVRPNQTDAYYVYVYNPNDQAKTYTLVLAKGVGAGDELLRQSVTVDPEKTVRVPIVAPAPPAPAPAAARPAAWSPASWTRRTLITTASRTSSRPITFPTRTSAA